MRKLFSVLAIAITAVLAVSAQQPAPNPKDPRIGLKPGFRDGGQAAWNMELVANLPKPEGFFDPKMPAGSITPPEPPPGRRASPSTSTPPGFRQILFLAAA